MAYPRGKLRPDDDGSVQIALAVKDGTVIVRFPHPVVWLGLGHDEAKALGEALIEKANEVKQ